MSDLQTCLTCGASCYDLDLHKCESKDFIRKLFREHDICCPEDLWQRDSVNVKLPEIVEAIGSFLFGKGFERLKNE